jgi:acetylornithine deacetylase/succinyl-diaminopimelate desuccinylase-like protein
MLLELLSAARTSTAVSGDHHFRHCSASDNLQQESTMHGKRRARGLGTCSAAFFALTYGLACAAEPAPKDEQAFRELYKQLVEINTTRSVGSCTKAADAMRARLVAGGIALADTQILAPKDRPQDGALIAVLHGRDRLAKPILLLAHIDVVEAKREDWERDPFKLIEEKGWFYGRGASDDKAMAAVFTDSLIRYRQEGFTPRRDIKLALTCGEETPDVFNSVQWLVKTQPQVLDAEFALNEGAGGELDKDGKPVTLQIQAGEKVYQDFALEAGDVGGHSSRPTHNNPIVRLSIGLARLGAYNFPVALNAATRGYFTAEAKLVPPETAADMRAVLANPEDEAAVERLWAVNPGWNGSLRTTCVVTEIEGGHAPNALPQHVRANVNCRILPGVPITDVQKQIVSVLGDDKISVAPTGDPGMQSPPPPLTEHIMDPVVRVADSLWPGVAIVPTMATGATDGRFLNATGIPTYGLSGMFSDAEGSHAHGLNERIRVKSLLDGRQFLYEVVKLYANDAK